MNQQLDLLIQEFVALMRHGADVYDLKAKALKRHPILTSEFIVTAIEAAEGRLHAEKLGLGEWASHGLFTKVGLQQSTNPKISSHHAQRFSSCKNILEICTGLGFDTVALARVSHHVTTLESDEWVASCASHNLMVQGVTNVKVITATAEHFVADNYLGNFDGLWADPSRRSGGKRIKEVADYQPALDWLVSLPISGVAGIKISPAVNVPELPTGWSKEWIGFERECKEQILWRSAGVPNNLVTLIDAGMEWSTDDEVDSADITRELPDSEPYYIVEPHGALSRSGTLPQFFQKHGISLMSEDSVYGFTVKKPSMSPFYEVFEVFDVQKYNRKKLPDQVKLIGWDSRTEIKKRNFAEDPDEIFKSLKLPKPDTTRNLFGVILLTKLKGENKVFFANRVKE